MLMRPATPLSVLFLVAFALLLLSTISTPVIKGIPLASWKGTDFGVFGYCTGGNCSNIEIGYDTGTRQTHSLSRLHLTKDSAMNLYEVAANPDPLFSRSLPHQARLLAARRHASLSVVHTCHTSRRGPPHPHLLRARSRCTFPLASTLASLPAWPFHSYNSNLVGIITCILS